MFSKALFKQSAKANGIMWAIITFAVCFMLASVMLISGSGNIAELKNGISNTIMESSIDAELENRSIDYYMLSSNGLSKFDTYFVKSYTEVGTYATLYYQYLAGTITEEPEAQTEGAMVYKMAMQEWLSKKPTTSDAELLNAWNLMQPKPDAVAYKMAIDKLTTYAETIAEARGYEKDSIQAEELKGVIFYVLNPNGQFDDFYLENETTAPSYDLTTIQTMSKEERSEYISGYAKVNSTIFMAGNMIKQDNIDKIVDQLKSFKITQEDYKALGYQKMVDGETQTVSKYTGKTGYEYMKNLGNDALLDFIARFNDKVEKLPSDLTEAELQTRKVEIANEVAGDVTSSILSEMPEKVSKALRELGEMDLYSMIVGSIFFKMAGLLLPIIYMIMVANNLVAGQVDSGSMAYILSTSTKRKQVIFTQAVYLVSSLFAMFALTTVTSLICLSTLEAGTVSLTYSDLILLNLGAFIVMFAMSGISFLASCWFNRSKYSMSIGGGLNMFFLVSTMLGLFGSKVLPSVIRLESLNFFNYCSVISLFDVISILDGSLTFLWKFAILIAIGVACYVVGGIKFKKKDLPL